MYISYFACNIKISEVIKQLKKALKNTFPTKTFEQRQKSKFRFIKKLDIPSKNHADAKLCH